MEIKLVHLVCISFILVSCFSSKVKLDNQNYIFHDQPKRNLEFAFNSDRSFILTNRVAGSLMFSTTGKWERLSELGVIITRDYDCSDASQGYPLPEKNIDVNLAYFDKSYIFPCIERDTLVFSKDMKSLIIKGFVFNLKK